MMGYGTGRLRGSGPSTIEKKDWLTTLKKGVALTIIIWLGLCMVWLLISTVLWLADPRSSIVYWFKDRPRIWLAVNVGLGIPCLVGMIIWARQELLDEDWTSLQGKHGLSGVVPMTPIVRLLFLLRWLRKRPGAARERKADNIYNFLFGDSNDGE